MRYKTLEKGISFRDAQIACVSFEPPTEETAKTPIAPKTLTEFRAAFLIEKNTTIKKDGTPLDLDTIHSYEQVTTEFIAITQRVCPGEIGKQDMRDWIIALRKRLVHSSVCNVYILVTCFLKFCGVDHKKLLPQSEGPTPVAHPRHLFAAGD